MNIRELRYEELEIYLLLLEQLDKESTLSLDEAEQMYKKIGQYPFYKIFCMTIDQTIAGTFSLIICDNFGHGGLKFAILENVVVHPGYKRMGLGKKMIEEAIKIATENDCYKLMLSSNEKRKEAHAFYDSLEFKRHGVSFVTELIK